MYIHARNSHIDTMYEHLCAIIYRARIVVQVTIYIVDWSRDGHLDQSEAYDIS